MNEQVRFDCASRELVREEAPAELLEGLEEAGLELRRAERNALLAASDWTQLPDAPLTPKKRDAWARYRQALRELELASVLEFPAPPK